jgi:hypothetical protein
MTDLVIEYLRELHRIVARRDGATYRTVHLHDVWVTEVDLQNPPEDHIYVVKGTSFDGVTIRRKKVADA